ncbi:MAG TPA: transglycosylase SLT domain-containing protein [Thermodesulfovibrionia bacterium]|nr:transglycosylase SLT domain-containing protein [Thermodesulfovibrionia bacterium]
MVIERQRKIRIFIQILAFVFFILIPLCSYAVLDSDKSPELSSDKLQDELNKQFKNALQLINIRSYKEAENILLTFVAQDLWLDKVYFLFGRLYKEQNFLDKAEDSFKKAAAHNYLLKDYALKLLADTYAAKKEYDKAVETLRQIQNKTLTQEAKQSEIASLLALKDEESAINVLSQYIKEYPGEWNYKLLLAQLLKNKERDKATSLFKETYINAGLSSADALKELEDMDAAKFTLEETLKRAENLLKNGSFESAETAFEKILKSIKDSVLKDKIRFSIGTCQFKQKKYSEAAKTFDLIKTPEAIYWRARAVYRADDTKDFEGIIKKFEKEYPWNQYLARLFILLADGKRRMGNLNEAEEIFKKVSNDFPEEAEDALWGIGWINYTNGNYRESEKIFSKLLSSKGNGRYLYWEAKSKEMLSKACMEQKAGLNTEDETNMLHINAKDNKNNPPSLPLRVMTFDKGGKGGLSGGNDACPDADTSVMYHSLLKDAGYYGFLAKRNLKEYNTINKTEFPKPKAPQGQVYKIIEALKSLEMNKEAVDEIRTAIRFAKSIEELKYLGEIAFELDEYRSVIYSVEGLTSKEVLPLAYPLGFWNIVKQASEREGMDPYIIVALIREESRFDPDALSQAGAIGLMQLMPFTAHEFKKELKIEVKNDSEIYNVKKNISIGTHYFSQLVKEFGILPLAIASYNAGEGTIRKWMLSSKHKDIEEFIEDIPYQETRNYVKRVMRSYWQYRAMNGLPIE